MLCFDNDNYDLLIIDDYNNVLYKDDNYVSHHKRGYNIEIQFLNKPYITLNYDDLILESQRLQNLNTIYNEINLQQ